VDIKEFYCDGKLSRSQNIKEASKHAGAINHITGDVNFLALGMKGKKNILTVHDLGHYDTLRKRSFLKFTIYKIFWFRQPLKYISIVTVVSEFTKSKLIEYFNFPDDRIRVIKNPVKPIFVYAPRERLSDVPRVLMMGTGVHKNLIGLIEAANGLNVHLDIVGWPSEQEVTKLKEYSIKHTLYSGLDDSAIYERFKECDIMFNASHYEGFGMPIIEAQSVGRPVIASNIGAMKEVAGESAVLVSPTDPGQIREAIERLCADRNLYDSYVKLGQANIEPYRDQTIANGYYEVYKEIAASL
jgi:glycosyltransferase involved in cell wall biosynthesis